jgi:hypothetical protein
VKPNPSLRTATAADIEARLAKDPGCSCETCRAYRATRATRPLPAEALAATLAGLRTADAHELVLLAEYLAVAPGPAVSADPPPAVSWHSRRGLAKLLTERGAEDYVATRILAEPRHAAGHVDVYALDHSVLVRHCPQCHYGLPPLEATLAPPPRRSGGWLELLGDAAVPDGARAGVAAWRRHIAALLTDAVRAGIAPPALAFVNRPPNEGRERWRALVTEARGRLVRRTFAETVVMPREALAAALAAHHPDAAEAVLDPSLLVEGPDAVPAVFACERAMALAAFRFRPEPAPAPAPPWVREALAGSPELVREIAGLWAEGWPASGAAVVAWLDGGGGRHVSVTSREDTGNAVSLLAEVDGPLADVFSQHEEPGHLAVVACDRGPTRWTILWVGCARCDLSVELGPYPREGGMR